MQIYLKRTYPAAVALIVKQKLYLQVQGQCHTVTEHENNFSEKCINSFYIGFSLNNINILFSWKFEKMYALVCTIATVCLPAATSTSLV